ncbi:hypothetical protein HDC90_000075 [Pedobacter sp. AK013]|nr:hypothetical protein [Pedobacter sp. AK013]
MRRIYTLGLIALFTGILCKSYAADGCYSLSTGRFYYVSIGSNNYSGFSYATSSSTATCSTFSSGTYTSSLCNIEGTSSPNYRQATTNLIYPCPIDEYIPFLMLLLIGLGFVTLKNSKSVYLNFSKY